MENRSEEEVKFYLRRMSRELDRFVITLMELESSTAVLLTHVNNAPPKEALASMQKIDYLCQCSSALSEVLTAIANQPPQDIPKAIEGIRPTDLSDRLKDEGLEDIDNMNSKIEIF